MKGTVVVILMLLLADVLAGRNNKNPRDPTSSLLNHLMELDESLPDCDQAFRRVQDGERAAHAPYPPDIKGSWVSQECETRPGPEFVLRHYQFDRDGSFKFLQHFYGDEWCTTPVYTLTARGQLQLREPSWVVPGAAEAEYTLHRVQFLAYSEDVVDEVMQRVNRTCPGYISRPWRVRKEYMIYNLAEAAGSSSTQILSAEKHSKRHSHQQLHNNGSSRKSTTPDLRPKRVSHNGSHHQHQSSEESNVSDAGSASTTEDVDCLSAFHAVYHELQLIRTVRRPRDLLQSNNNNNKKNSNPEQTLLFLGDVHPQLDQRASYRPTSYQPALVRQHEASDCHVCRLVAKSSDRSPPHLHARPRLPVYPVGDWVSSACETRSIGTFLMRRMKFVDHQNGLSGWEGSSSGPSFQALFHYFADPACSRPTLTVLAGGSYSPGSDSERVQGATEFDFYVRSVSITVHDDSTARNLNGLKGDRCGIDGSWTVGRPQDVTLTGGCLGLGIRVPTVANDLLKMDLNGVGHPLLYFGIAENPTDIPTAATSAPVRPTSYLPALHQCQSQREDLASAVETSNEIEPLIPYARVGGVSSGSVVIQTSTVLLFPLLAFTMYRILI